MAKKTTAKKTEKTATAKAETKPAKPRKEKAPRESRDGWGTFALKLPVPEREAFHKAAGPASASRFARAVLAAFAAGDDAAFKAIVKEAREQRA